MRVKGLGFLTIPGLALIAVGIGGYWGYLVLFPCSVFLPFTGICIDPFNGLENLIVEAFLVLAGGILFIYANRNAKIIE